MAGEAQGEGKIRAARSDLRNFRRIDRRVRFVAEPDPDAALHLAAWVALHADPIDIELSSDQVTLIDYLVPFRNSLVEFTKAGRQFELNAPDNLTPTSAAITPTTAYLSMADVRPQQMGSMLYFAATRKDAAILYEYFYDDTRISNFAAKVGPALKEFFMEQGLLIRPLGNVVYLLPPYCVTDDQLHRAYDAIEHAITEVI